MEDENITAKSYFDYIKTKKNKMTSEELKKFYDGCYALAEKYLNTGQKLILEKLKFYADIKEKEFEALDNGIDTYILREDIEEYIDSISKNPVKIVELENYPRDIPDDVMETFMRAKNIFDKFYVLFTDYTGKVEKTIRAEEKTTDPILFGTFQQMKGNRIVISDRFYVIGSWEDEFCDLTLDKFIAEAGKEKVKAITHLEYNPKEIYRDMTHLLGEDKKMPRKKGSRHKKSFFEKVFRK